MDRELVLEAQVDLGRREPDQLTEVPQQLAARWAVHRAQTTERLGEAVIDALAARLRRHVRMALRDPNQAVALPGSAPASG